jgi:NitT/TauT family transport system substrate-binding protein
MADQPARLTPLGKLISILLILGLIGFGSYIVLKRSSGGKLFSGGKSSESIETEAADTSGVTTVKEYKYVAADKLPAVKGVSQYRWDEKEKILRFSYNVWAGWLPVIAANRGTKPNPESVFAKKYGFRVDARMIPPAPVESRCATSPS